ncbi:MAG: gliding motility-associated C-terminal domain-containing protein [Chitinophagales bacterium]
MRKLLGIGILATAFSYVSAQSITAYPDTVICSDNPVWLYADVDGSYGTEEYTYEEVPFSPEPVGGTVHNMVDDTHVGPFSIGFDFCFFGEIYTQFYICSNGWISFLNPTGAMDINWTPDGPIPSAAANVPKAAIFFPWTDWNSGLCTNCIYHEVVGTAPNRKLIVTFDNVPLFLCGDLGTFQVVLHETTNQIDNHLTHTEICPTWDLGIAVQGLQNATGTAGYAIAGRNATAWSADDESWVWLPNAITWIDLSSGLVIGTGDSIEVAPAVTTSYAAEVLLCDGTTASDTVTVTVETPYDVSVDVNNIICNGDANASIAVIVTGNTNPVTYSWDTGETDSIRTGLGPGTYTVTVQELGGCAYSETIDITEPPVLTLDTLQTAPVTCFGGDDGLVSLTASGGVGPYIFSYDGITYQTDSTFSTMSYGSYTFQVKDANGCVTTFGPVFIDQPAPITVDAGPNQVIALGSSTILTAGTPVSPIATIVWTPAEGLNCTDCLQPEAGPFFNTVYYITITDADGCSATDSVEVWVDADFVVPSAFTPNGDGLNDFFTVQSDFLTSFEMSIYNRWGREIFHSNDLKDGWDGNLDGIPQEMGTYVYIIDAVSTQNTPIRKAGTVALLR